jgi:hypothetical protein
MLSTSACERAVLRAYLQNGQPRAGYTNQSQQDCTLQEHATRRLFLCINYHLQLI